jgi:hypothetical protein
MANGCATKLGENESQKSKLKSQKHRVFKCSFFYIILPGSQYNQQENKALLVKISFP